MTRVKNSKTGKSDATKTPKIKQHHKINYHYVDW